METDEPSTIDGFSTSQLRVVLLGGRNSGKSSVGNLLLGKEEFVTKERTSCSRRLGLVSGRWLTVVDTPGWWCDFSSQDTSELVKQEIVSSVFLCSPGPHVFVVTIKASSGLSERRRRAVEEHVTLLGEEVWGHCLVVFTSTHRAKHMEAEELVHRGGETLHWLSNKCNHRCHSVLLNDDAEVNELLQKILKLVTENENRVFEMKENTLQVIKEKKRVEERAERRFVKVKQHRASVQEKLRPVTDIRMVLLGAKGSGKTSVMNTILLRNDTSTVRRTARCEARDGLVFGRRVTVVDTPGWWMNYYGHESTVFDRREMALSLTLCPPGPHVFLLVIRVDRAFTQTYRRAVQEHLQLISEHIWTRVIVVFSFGDWLGGTTTERHIESEGESLLWLIEKCDNRYHVLNNKTKGDGFQVRELIGKIEELLTEGNSLQYYEIEKKVMEQLEAEMRRERERAEERLMRKETQRQMARSQLEKLGPLKEISIVIVGGKKTGKSSCGNTILNRESFNTDTQTTSCSESRGNVSGRMVRVLDTPGCFPVTSDLFTASPHCIVLIVINVSASFKDKHMKELEKQLEGGGGRMWSRAVVVFSYGDWLGDTGVERRIESEGEALRRFVEKCGNRYHVLDNKHLEDGAQVSELMDLMDETLVGGRMKLLHGRHHMWKSVCAEQEHELLPDTVTAQRKDLKTSCDSTETQTSSSCGGGDTGGQMVTIRRRRRGGGGRGGGGGGGGRGVTILDGNSFMSVLASILSVKNGRRRTTEARQTLTINLPIRFFNNDNDDDDEVLSSFRLNSENQLVLVLPQTQNELVREENVFNVRRLCSHPALRQRTLQRLGESGDLQQLIDRWGDSSLEELEAFIDSYFEMVWEQTMESVESPATEKEKEEEEEEEEQEVLSSIDRKLSKLELLDEIRSDLNDLRENLQRSWDAIDELRQKNEQESDKT